MFKIKSELREVYWNLFLETFAKSLIGLFVPIYLLTLGYTLPHALAFLLFYMATLFVMSPLSATIAHRIGLKHLVLYRVPLFIVYYSLLISFQFLSVPLASVFLTAVLGGISSAFYWMPMNTEFVKNTNKLREGEEIGKVDGLKRLAAIFAPTIGGLVLTFSGFTPLFALVIIIAVISVFPLFATNDYRGRVQFNQERRFFFKNKRLTGRLILNGPLAVLEAFVWPLAIFSSLNSVLDVGIAASISGFGMALFTLVIGKFSDHQNKQHLMKIGGLAYAIVWIARMFAGTQMEFFLLSLLGGMFYAVLQITVFSSFCDAARGRNVLDWVVVRETWMGVGRVTLFLLLLVATGAEFPVAFSFATIAALLLVFI